MALFWWLFQFEEWVWVPVAFYVWHSIAAVMIVSQFWSFANHSLDPRQAKRLFAFIGAGAGLGGGIGGLYASAAADALGTHNLLLVSAAIQVGIAILIYITVRVHQTDEARVAGAAGMAKLEAARGGFDAIRASRHLMLISALMLCTVAVANIVNLQFLWAKSEVEDALDQTTSDFGIVYSITSFFGFFFHMFFTARIHRGLGIGVAMRMLPVYLGFATVGLMITANLFADPNTLFLMAAALLIGEKGLRYSLDQATRELLFLPVPSKARFKAKSYIDVFIQRFAKGVGAIFVLIGGRFLGMSIVQVGIFSLGIIAVWLGVTVALRSSFVRSFRDGLRARSVDTQVPIDLSDTTSLEVMVQSLGSPDPRQVLNGLEMLTYHGKEHLVPPLLLYHESPEVKIRTLEILLKADRADAAPLVERLLGDEDHEVRTRAMQSLAALHSENFCELMVPRLGDADLRVRAAAISSVVNHGTDEEVAEASTSLVQLAADASVEARRAAASAVAKVDEPTFQEVLVQLLYDQDTSVAARAIEATRARVRRGGGNPMFPPILVSLMRDRRLKHEAREALVAYGEAVIPQLVHFMNDPQEQMWVRRAVPKTVARIGGQAAAEALLDNLGSSDQFLRRKVIEALASLRSSEPDLALPAERIAEEIQQEARRYFLNLTDMVSVAGTGGITYEAPTISWQPKVPALVQRLIADRTQYNLEIIFGMLALLHSPRDIRAAYQALTNNDAGLKAHALEYLDNTLSGDVHRAVFAVINDEPLEEKIKIAHGTFDLSVQPGNDVLRRLVIASVTDEEEAHWLGAAAVYAIYVDKIEELYPQIEDTAGRTDASLAQETAAWGQRTPRSGHRVGGCHARRSDRDRHRGRRRDMREGTNSWSL